MEHLLGSLLPAVYLAATSGVIIDLSRLTGLSVVFCYPWTGRPGHGNPPGWDEIPGAHGSTPQAQAYARAYEEFRKLGVKLFGLSFQETEWQREFAVRCGIGFPLLSDARREFSSALGLPVFRAGEEEYLKRLTIIAEDGRIVKARFPVERPEADAAEVLEWLRARPPPSR